MDWAKAIHYAQMVQAAEEVTPGDLCQSRLVIGNGDATTEYTILSTIFANDLATENNQARRELIVSIGFVAQSDDGAVVIALRGTCGIHEWLHDCCYLAVPCPVLPDAGVTEDGFTDIYNSLRTCADEDAPRLCQAFAAMDLPRPVTSLTLCGHSLGAAVVTLLALDIAANTPYKDLTLYTYASPRLGDERFAEVFNRLVPNTFRVANRMDIVTEVPPSILCHETPYRHVEATTMLVPGKEVGHHLVCMHHLTTYLYLMTVSARLPADLAALLPDCCRANEHHWVGLLERHHRAPVDSHL